MIVGKKKSNMGRKPIRVGEKHRLPSGTMVRVRRVEAVSNPNFVYARIVGKALPVLKGIHSDDLRVFRDDLTASVLGRMKDCPTMTWEEARKTPPKEVGIDLHRQRESLQPPPTKCHWVSLKQEWTMYGEKSKPYYYAVNIAVQQPSNRPMVMENRFLLDVMKVVVDGEPFPKDMDVGERRRLLYLLDESFEEDPMYFNQFMVEIHNYEPLLREIETVELSLSKTLNAMRKEALRRKKS
jgi:hypothetical protein